MFVPYILFAELLLAGKLVYWTKWCYKWTVIILTNFVAVNGSDRVSLTSGPNTQNSECPGDIVFTCHATRLSGVVWWINSNTTPIAEYADVGNIHLPFNLTTSDSLHYGLVIILTSVFRHNPPLNNYTTIACISTENLLTRNISRIWCGRSLLNSSLTLSTYGGNYNYIDNYLYYYSLKVWLTLLTSYSNNRVAINE